MFEYFTKKLYFKINIYNNKKFRALDMEKEKGDTDSCGEDLGDLVLALNSNLYTAPKFGIEIGPKKVSGESNHKKNVPI